LRQRKASPDIVDVDSEEYGPDRAVDSSKDPYESHVRDLEREQVRHAIQQPPLEFLEIILLREYEEYEELPCEEIAVMLQCPVGTVISRLARARSKLPDMLAASAMAASEVKGAKNAKDTQREVEQPG
jgi:RNA polymerase sigma-70 factor, ECF subfamily